MQQSAMHILIDGYNLIRQSPNLRRFERQSLEAGRKALIEWLSLYRRRKRHRITVVFDGWAGGSPLQERDSVSGIGLIYSPLGVKADEIIKEISAATDEEILVVSSDREITSFAERHGKTALPSQEFETYINRLMVKPDDYGKPDKQAGDEYYTRRSTAKKGPSRRLSRSRKRTEAIIRKL